MLKTPIKTITLDGFLVLPETKSASEYIDEKIIQKPIKPEFLPEAKLTLGDILVC
jgi:hypothetical protein